MIISFIGHLENYTTNTGVDLTGYPDLIHQEECTHDLSLYDAQLVENEETGQYSVLYTLKPTPPENQSDKHERIRKSIISAESLEEFDLEGEEFSDIEIGDIITSRVFGGNPHAEKALTNKVLNISIQLLQGTQMTEEMSEKIAQAQVKKQEVDAVRNLFNLGNI